MNPTQKSLAMLATFFGLVLLLGSVALVPYAPPVFLALSLMYGWMLFTYLQYRWGRQEELLQLLTTAVESGTPLAPAILAYLTDRPRGVLREFWVALLLFFVVPGYYWIWHRQRSFDSKAARVALWLELGVPLHQALRIVPGVASRQTALAAAVGEATGQMALCLRGSPRSRLPAVVLETLPRVVYPLLLLVFMSAMLGFWGVFILPKMEKIFSDFHVKLPQATEQLAFLARHGHVSLAILLVALFGVAASAAVLIGSSHARWYCPGFGRVYRMDVRGSVLKMLSVFLEAGKPLPEALGLLADSGFFPSVAARRVRVVRLAVQQGEPLAAALRRGGLLPSAMVPLVLAAERSHRLPWALAELGEELSSRATRLLKRISLFVFPACVAAIGVLAGVQALGMFYPLVDLIWRMIP